MHEKEKIRLDAELTDVIGFAAFHARLANGHEIVAYPERTCREEIGNRLRPGSRVRVELSPFDMAKGTIVEIVKV